MANLTTVTLTNGGGTGGSGTVSTLDNLIGTAGTSSAQVQTVQGIASMTPVQVSQATAANLNATVRNADGSGNLLTSTGNALDINIKSGVNANGRAVPGSSAPVVQASQKYQAVAASQTGTALVGAGAGA